MVTDICIINQARHTSAQMPVKTHVQSGPSQGEKMVDVRRTAGKLKMEKGGMRTGDPVLQEGDETLPPTTPWL